MYSKPLKCINSYFGLPNRELNVGTSQGLLAGDASPNRGCESESHKSHLIVKARGR